MATAAPPARPTPAARTPSTPPTRNPVRPSIPSSTSTPAPKTFGESSGVKKRGQRIVIYGPGGIGKTTLAALAPDPKFIDIDSGGTDQMDVRRVTGVETFPDVRAALREESLWKGVGTTVVDSGTKLQEFAVAYTVATVKHEKGHPVKSVEDYGFGKGYQHVYDTFLPVLADLDRHIEQGRNVILICHSVIDKAPNPEGDDWSQHQLLLQMPPKTGQLRTRVRDWADHVLFINYDKSVKDGKATGQGTRTIYVNERPAYWAKSRTLRDPIDYPEGSDEVWRQLGLIQ